MDLKDTAGRAGKITVLLCTVHLEDGPEAVPLGAACTASAMKAVFAESPAAAEIVLVETFADQGAGELIKKIRPRDAAAIGFSLYSWNRAVILGAAEKISRDSPEVFLFCGGPEAGALPGGLAKKDGGPFDEVIAGEGEAAAAGLVQKILFRAGVQKPEAAGSGTPAGDQGLSGYPSPWLDGTLVLSPRTGALWELARGCPYGCAYCYESKGLRPGTRRPHYISDERLIGELRYFAERRTPYIFVLDPTFNADNKRAVKILDLIEKEAGNLDIHWHFEVRGELLSREQARRFARLGASLQIGLQSADPKVCSLAGRGLDRELFAAKIKLLNGEGVIFGLDLIYGLPGDSLSGFRKSLDYALSLYPNNVDLFRLAVLPGTVMAEKAGDWGLEYSPEAPYGVTGTPSFSGENLLEAERLSRGADLFYNRGRAVAWFIRALRPLRIKPSAFLGEFAAYAEAEGLFKKNAPENGTADAPPAESHLIEKDQLEFLEIKYREKNKAHILPALRDIVRYHGAWGRALAEGTASKLTFSYNPADVLAAPDLEEFAAFMKRSPRKVSVGPES